MNSGLYAGRRFGDGDRGRMGEAVAVADDERLEGVALVQLRGGPGMRARRAVLASGQPGAGSFGLVASRTRIGIGGSRRHHDRESRSRARGAADMRRDDERAQPIVEQFPDDLVRRGEAARCHRPAHRADPRSQARSWADRRLLRELGVPWRHPRPRMTAASSALGPCRRPSRRSLLGRRRTVQTGRPVGQRNPPRCAWNASQRSTQLALTAQRSRGRARDGTAAWPARSPKTWTAECLRW